MKLQMRLSLIVIMILLIVVAAVSGILVAQARSMQIASVKKSIDRLGDSIAMDLRRHYETYLQNIVDLACIMGDYRAISADTRRERFVTNMASIMDAQKDLKALYAVWLPDILDRDAAHRGEATADETGRFIPWVVREENRIEIGKYADYETALRQDQNKQTLFEPKYQSLHGKEMWIFSIQVPIKTDDGSFLGFVGANVEAAATQALVQEYIDDKERLSDVAAVGVYTNAAVIIGYTIPSFRGQNAREANSGLYGKKMNEVLDTIKNGKSLYISGYSSTLKSNLMMVLSPLEIGDTNVPWSVMVGCMNSVALKSINSMIFFAIIVVVSSLILSALTISLVSRSIAKPIVNVALTLKDISEGEGDLTKSIPVTSKDEVGDLARYFNATLEKIRALVITIKQQSAALFDIGSELSANTTETASAINQITANIQSIKTRVVNQSASVTETNATMEQITINIDKLNGHVERQAESVSQSSSAIEEMLANIQSVTQTLVRNAENVRELTDASEIGRGGLREVVTDIQEIARESEGLLEINAVMENIASQTNLLSMNAAIEAAHAGEAGKGFAVVADEIRKLAESSGEQSKTISAVLKKIKDAIDKITKSTEAVLEKFGAIDAGVRIVSEQEENIRGAMEEQSTGSKQILEAIAALNELTEQVKGGSEEMMEGSREVITEGKNLEMATQEITHGMNEMSAGADQINTAVNQVNEISSQNKKNIEVLVKEVSRFKVE
ncbi:MAG: methyl-accepting chemotaxis protein [Treponema sp.]|jgi:methyl-accepting chemotaxis protein|nr:methyl-accepting chemotaxis protein [Treponema sp.]